MAMRPYKIRGGQRLEVRVPYVLERADVLALVAGHYCADIFLGDAGYRGATVPKPTTREVEKAIRDRLRVVGESWWSWDTDIDEQESSRAREMAEVWVSRFWPAP